jgi:magnesium transporter
MGLYTPDHVTPLEDVHTWENPGDGDPEPRLRELRDACASQHEGFVWVGLFEPTAAETAMVRDVFGIPHLQMEDITNVDQRPKFEIDEHGHGLALLKVLDYVEDTSDVTTGQVSVYLGDGFALTVRYGQAVDLAPIRARLDESSDLRGSGPIGVLYAVLDRTVDGYLAVANEVSMDVETLEASIFAANPSVDSTNAIYRLKRENVEIRRAVQPLVPWAQDAISERADWVPEAMRPYFRDVGDHLLRAHDSTESSDTLLMTMLMASTSLQDLQQNRDMRKISAWVAIAAVPTMIAGIYGMNFDYMPELHWAFGYPMILLIMGGACTLMYRAFRRSGWL